ncbi:MAG: hypothetical protein U0939_04335 [Pirellulales bacterium]
MTIGWGPLWGACGAAAGALAASLLGIAGGWLQSLVMGVGVGAALGAALAAFNVRELLGKARFWQALFIGVAVGVIGGGVGATIGQALYAAASVATGESNSAGLFSSEMRERLTQAGAKSGELEIGLIWENTNDLDLYVVDPQGDVIYFGARRSPSGGELDIDRNAACQKDLTSKPVEHVVWQTGTALKGDYRILVHEFSNCGHPDPTPFRVELVTATKRQTFEGTTRHGDPPLAVHTFRYPLPPDRAPLIANLIGLLARVIGWTLFGAIVGSAQGAVRRSLESFRNGALGGLIGGAAGGFAFAMIAGLLAIVLASSSLGDVAGRFLGCAILGACIGLGIAIIERVFSSVLTIRSGRYEGRDIILDRPITRIGRNEVLELYLGGDAAIAAHHATIERQGRDFVIVAVEGSVSVNGQPVTRHTLATNDQVTLGGTRMVFRGKRAAAGGAASRGAASAAGGTTASPAQGTNAGPMRITAPPPPPPPPARPAAPPTSPAAATPPATSSPPASPPASAPRPAAAGSPPRPPVPPPPPPPRPPRPPGGSS